MISTLYIIVFVIVAIFLTIATEIEWFGCTTITILVSVSLIQFLHLFNIWIYVKDHVLQTTIYSIAYIAIGVVWSFAKWFFFLINSRDRDREFVKKNLDNTAHIRPPVINIPQAADNKGKIIAWASYWPFSFIGTILNDPFRKLFNFIFNQFKNLYQQMANSIYKDDVEKFKNDLAFLEKKANEEREKLMGESVKLK